MISPDLKLVQPPFKQGLESFELIENVFFVERGVVSTVNEPENGDFVELSIGARAALVIFGSRMALGHSPKTRLVVMITDVRS